jgi:hypothetical protein
MILGAVFQWGVRVSIFVAAALLAQSQAITIDPIKTDLRMGEQTIGIAVGGSVERIGSGDLYQVTVNIDLGDFARNLTALLKPQIERADECGERIELQDAAIAADPPGAVSTIRLHYEKWGCAKAFGKQIVKRLVGGNGVVKVKLTPVVEFNRVRLESEVGDIQADGSLGELLRSGGLGKALREKIHRSLAAALEKATDWDATIPHALREVASFQTIGFTGGAAGQFGLSVGGQVHLKAEQFKGLANQKSN